MREPCSHGLRTSWRQSASIVAKKTIAAFEGGNRTPYGRTLEALQEAFEKAGIEFIDPNGGGEGLRMKLPSGAAGESLTPASAEKAR